MRVRIRASAIAVAVAVLGALLALPASILTADPAGAATITTTGPLTAITTSPDLNCAVNHVDDSHGEFFGDTACGTFAVVDDVMYSPATIPAGQPGTPWTQVSQTGPTGTGTAADPLKVVTVVDAGTSGVRLTQTDTYVTGEESYRTDVRVTNSAGAAKTVRVYRAGDCYLQGSDSGFGQVDEASGAVACKSATSDRIEQFLPITPGSSYYEAGFSAVWSQITAKAAFPNTCLCDSNLDNGAGLSWDAAVAAGASTTISSILTFSPVGHVPLTVTKTADAAESAPGAANGYTIEVNNPNTTSVDVASISDTLPAGFTYTTGSTTGATTSDPAIASGTLTWTGPWEVGSGGTVTLHFGVTVSSTPGTYSNNATAVAPGFTVAPTGDTAPVTVTAVTPPVTLAVASTGQPATVTAGANAVRDVTVSNSGTAAATGTTTSLAVPAGVTLVSAAPSQGTCGPLTAGVVTCALGSIPGGGSATVRFVLRMPTAGTVTTSASAAADGGAAAGPSTSSTTVSAATPGTASGYIPPGGTLSTGTDATAADNTVSSLTLPNSGPGAVTTITSVPCAPGVCLGKTVTYTPFPGYDDPAHPIVLKQTWDKTVAGGGLLTQLYVQKEGQTSFSKVPPCQPAPSVERVWNGHSWVWKIKKFLVTIAMWLVGGHSNYANPSPCVNAKSVLRNGDVQFQTLFLSGDPSVRRR